MKIRVPAQPALNEVEARGGLGALFPQEEVFNGATGDIEYRIAREHKVSFDMHRRRLHRAETQGWLDYFHADELAIDLLDAHPAEIWGAAWWDYPDDTALQDRLAGRERKTA